MADIHVYHWLAFGGLVAILLALDLFVFHRDSHEPSLRESAGWTVFWCSLAMAFNALVWWWRGAQDGLNFLTGYLVEWSLSMDNVFVFVVIFRYFRIPMKYQYRVLYWGILGAILLRLAFILLGTQLIHRFHWVLPIFGVFLIYTAAKLMFHSETDVHPENNVLLRAARRIFRVSRGDHQEHGHQFFTRENGMRAMTPMFLVLLVVESTDVMFAVDSVPAIFGITDNAFIVFTSNIFAILGLRALYFLLAGVVDLFRYLRFGLAAVLGFVGLKMVAEFAVQSFGTTMSGWASTWGWERLAAFLAATQTPESGGRLIPPWLSLVVVVGLLAVAILASVVASQREKRQGLAVVNRAEG